MRIVAAEEHFATREFLDLVKSVLRKDYPDQAVVEREKPLPFEVGWMVNGLTTTSAAGEETTIENRLIDWDQRVRVMDEEGIDVQVLSFVAPGTQLLDPATAITVARQTNDEVARVIKRYPGRFVGLAEIAPQDPSAAADELERAVRQLGMRGANINSHIQGEYLDDKKFWPILERAEKLEVPIYIHPRTPAPGMFEFYSRYPELTRASLGFGAETALHAMRLIMSGAFDEFPKLKIVLGHLGEAIPFWLWRMDNRVRTFKGVGSKQKRTPSEYFRNNFVVTTSGNYWVPAFLCAYLALGADNIMFAVDYPFQMNWEATPFLQSLPVSPRDQEKISHLNAERVFGF